MTGLGVFRTVTEEQKIRLEKNVDFIRAMISKRPDHKCGEVVHEIKHLIEGRQYQAPGLEQNKICAEIQADNSMLSFLESISASPDVIKLCEQSLRKYLEFVCGDKMGVFRLEEWKLALRAFQGLNDREVWRSILAALNAPPDIIEC